MLWPGDLAEFLSSGSMTSCSSFLHLTIFFFFDMVTKNYLCTLRFNPSHIRLCCVPALQADLTWHSHTHRADISHISVRADSWRALCVSCWQLHVWPGTSQEGMFGPWLTWWVERGHFPANSVNVTTSRHWMRCLHCLLCWDLPGGTWFSLS